MLRVGHVGLTVPDLNHSVEYAEKMLGLRVSERSRSVAYLTCNARHHELVLSQGAVSQVSCDHLAFEVLDLASYEATVARVQDEGLPILERGQLEPGITDAVRFRGPGGFTIEVFHGMRHDQPARYATVAPTPLKFEHITLKSTNKPAFEDLLIRVLGLRMSDRAESRVSWLRASDEHHGVSVIAADVDALHHYAWQMDSFGTFARVGDHLMQNGQTFLWGPGHHGIGDNYFCYFRDSDGAIVEFSAGIQHIDNDADYEPRVWPDEALTVNRWGNPPPPPEFEDAATTLLVREVPR